MALIRSSSKLRGEKVTRQDWPEMNDFAAAMADVMGGFLANQLIMTALTLI
jgi:hypothetical protein